MSLFEGGFHAVPNIPNKEIRMRKEVARTKSSAAHQTPNIEEKIRGRAYELFEARGAEVGHELEDWLQAEGEISGGKTNAVGA